MALTSNLSATDRARRLTVGLSGGMDSTVLLHWLKAHGVDVIAVHCHHGLHADADLWAQHCEQLCERLGVPLHVVHLDPNAIHASRNGIEAAARKLRMDALCAEDPGRTVVLGHHQDDQAETFLLRALRGSSAHGLGAMREHSRWRGTALWRPLLNTSRASLVEYANQHDLTWIDDPSNSQTHFDRNFLRLQVLPLLQTRWPAATERLARSAQLAALDASALLALEHRSSMPDALPLENAHERARAVRAWIADKDLPPLPESAQEAIERVLQGGRTDSDFRVEGPVYSVRLWRGALHVVQNEKAAWACPCEISVPPNATLHETFADGSQLVVNNPMTVDLVLRLLPRKGGEKIQLVGRPSHTSVKKLLNASEVPPWSRASMPLIYGDCRALWWVGNLHCSQEYHEWCDRTGGSVEWHPFELN